MPLDPLLVEVLACPVDKGPLLWFAEEDLLYNPRLRKSYAVRDGVPVMLIDEATDVGDTEHERLTAKAAAGGVPETGRAGHPSEGGQDGSSAGGGPGAAPPPAGGGPGAAPPPAGGGG